MVIQYIASLIIAFILIKLFLKVIKDRIAVLNSVFWIFFWVGTLVLLWFPKFLEQISNLLGVGRGVDILIYLSIIFLFYIILNQNSKIEKLNKGITKLIREVAKNEAK